MVVWTTVDVWTPIKDWILGLKIGPKDKGLRPGWRPEPQIEI